MGFFNKRAYQLRMPMVPAGHGIAFAHTLLHDAPIALVAYNEIMRVQLEAILDSCIIHFGTELTMAYQFIRIQAGLFANANQFLWCLFGKFTLTTTDINS